MIDPVQLQNVQSSLCLLPQRLYALLDGASIANVTELLAGHPLPQVCLLPGELEPELAQAAPYLVQLEPRSPLTGQLIGGEAGPHWGLLAVADADFRALRMHCRRLLSVWGPDGTPLHFRYYDPRVLRIYLPTCRPDELALLFGPIQAFYGEAEGPETLLRYTFDGVQLGQQPIRLSAAGAIG